MQQAAEVITEVAQTGADFGWFHAACVLAAAVGGIARTLRDDKYQSFDVLLGLCLCSGLIGGFIVAALCRISGGYYGVEGFYILLAGVIGTAGKEADQFVNRILHSAIKKIEAFFGVSGDDED